MVSQPAVTLAARPAPPEVPQGWSVGWSDTHKRWYFVNNETNLTQWKSPAPAGQQQQSQQPQEVQQATATPGHDVNAPEESPLPAGWTSHWSEEHHHYYFLNAATGKSQWEPPQPEKPRDTAELPSQLRPPTAKHIRSSSQPPLRSGSKSEHRHEESTPGDLFSNPQSRNQRPSSEDEFHIEQPERPRSHVFAAPFDPPRPANTGVFTPPMWSYGVPESAHSSPGARGRQPRSPGEPAELEHAPVSTYGAAFAGAYTPSPPRLSPKISPQNVLAAPPALVPSALNPYTQTNPGPFLNPADISRPSSRSSETEILPAYSYSPGFSSKYSSYQPAAPEDPRSHKRFSAYNPDLSVIPKEPQVGVVRHPENYDFLP